MTQVFLLGKERPSVDKRDRTGRGKEEEEKGREGEGEEGRVSR